MKANSEKNHEYNRSPLATLREGLKRCRAIIEAAQNDRRGAALSDLYHNISTFKRTLFLSTLGRFLSSHIKAEVKIICSASKGGREVSIFSAGRAECEQSEHLNINIIGLDNGALIPLISLLDGRPTLEGVINVTSSTGEVGDGPELNFLAVAAPLIAQCFRNLKTNALVMVSAEGAGRERPETPRSGRVSGGVIERWKSMLAEKERAMDKVEKPREEAERGSESAKPRRRHILRKIFFGLFVIAFIFLLSGLASYGQVGVLRAPFNNGVAIAGDWLGGIPWQATKRALDDGLLHVWIHSDSAQDVHDWLKGRNPSGVDYEEVLVENGWSERDLHHFGRILGMVP